MDAKTRRPWAVFPVFVPAPVSVPVPETKVSADYDKPDVPSISFQRDQQDRQQEIDPGKQSMI